MFLKVTKEHSWIKNEMNAGTLRGKQRLKSTFTLRTPEASVFMPLKAAGSREGADDKAQPAQYGEYNMRQNSGIVCIEDSSENKGYRKIQRNRIQKDLSSRKQSR